MKQSQKYGLNLIEDSDRFSPTPLNENMEKLEQAFDAEADAWAAADAVLAKRITNLEARKVTFGTYTGSGSGWRTINLGFYPRYLYIQQSTYSGAWYTPNSNTNGLNFVSNGFETFYKNESGASYLYIAVK